MSPLARRRQRSLFGLAPVGLAGAVLLLACHEEVPLGAWQPATSAGGAGGSSGGTVTVTGAGPLTGAGAGVAMAATLTNTSTDGGAGAPANPGLPACLEPAVPGDFNRAGAGPDPTEMATDWTWPSPVASMEWDLIVEREIVRADPTAARPSTGYYWTHQFSFEGGIDGFLGIQAEGGYRESEEVGVPYDWTKMAVFWLSGPPLDAELGDIAFPDARIATESAAGVFYWTIHARFDWQACRTYHFRFGPESTETDGSTWYGAWIEDVDAGVQTFLGRMLLPAGSGQLSAFSMSRSMHIDFVDPPISCDTPGHASALFGTPSANGGEVGPVLGSNRFALPLGCVHSRFTAFEGAVRHEMGVKSE